MAAQLFRNISGLVTLRAAAEKGGRNIQEQDLSLLTQAALLVDRGRILWAGQERQLKSSRLTALLGADREVKEIDLGKREVIPAFVEAHTHLLFAGERQAEFEKRMRGATYQDIAASGGGILATVTATRKARQEQLVDLAQRRVRRFLEQGVTTIEVKSGYGLDGKSELKMLRAIGELKSARIIPTFLGLHAIPQEFKGNGDGYVDEMIKVLSRVAREHLAKRVDVFIEKGYFTVSQARRWFEAAQKSGLAMAAHTEQMSATGGWQAALDFNALSVDHAVHLNEAAMQTLATSQTTCVLLPGADFYLDLPYPPARGLIDRGARVAIATDFNPGSCPTQDLSFIGLLARLNMKMTLPEVLAAYTLGASHALGLAQELGSLEAGKSADFSVLEGSWRDLFYEVGRHPVAQVWHKGRCLKK